MICSATVALCSYSYGPGVAETKTAWLTWCSNSVEGQRAVVQRGGQAEAVVHQHLLARAVAVEHAAHLWQRDVRLVDDQQVVVRQVVEQRPGRLASRALGQVARVVLDAGADARLAQHLEIEVGALAQPRRLQQLALGVQAP